MSISELFPQVGLVLQNADAQLFNSTVEDELVFGMESLGLPAKNIEARLDNTSKLLNIESFLKRPTHRLSGGEKRMVGIASILCLRPSILVLDEPYANLDQSNAKRVCECLKNVHTTGVTVVVIEQRINGYMEGASRCFVVDRGKIIFDGNPGHSKTILVSKKLIPQYPKRGHINHSKTMVSYGSQDPVLSIRQLTCTINGEKILDHISFEIFKGQSIALIGKNGAGKTTLIKHLNGLYHPTHGKIKLNGHDLIGKNPTQIAGMVGLSFQNPNDQFFKTRVEDELQVGLHFIQKEYHGWLEQICHLFQIDKLLHRSPFKLSEGEKKRVAIASILAMKPQVLILDEPTAGQDGRSKEILAAILQRLSHEGLTIMVATHDLEFAQATTDRWIILDQGKIVQDGPPVFSSDNNLTNL